MSEQKSGTRNQKPETRNPGLPLRVGVIGVGHLGSVHARIYGELPGVELAGVADADAARAAAVAARCRTRAFPSAEALLAAGLDAVSVAVPTTGHLAVGRLCLEAGVPALIEKPLAKTLAEADALVRLSRERKVALQVGHVERFNPALLAVRDRIGAARFIECHRLSPFKFRSTDIDVVLDLMIHDLDIVLHLVRAPLKEVRAVGVSVLLGEEDIANARLEFEDGSIANLTASRVSDKAMRRMRVFSEDAYLSLDFLERAARIFRKVEGFEAAVKALTPEDRKLLQEKPEMVLPKFLTVEAVEIPEEEPLKAELASFVDAVRNGTDPLVPGEHGLRAMAAADRILREIRAHTWGRASN